jgi:hypothetical protein
MPEKNLVAATVGRHVDHALTIRAAMRNRLQHGGQRCTVKRRGGRRNPSGNSTHIHSPIW